MPAHDHLSPVEFNYEELTQHAAPEWGAYETWGDVESRWEGDPQVDVLAQSMATEGLRVPLEVEGQELVDGHRRSQAMRMLSPRRFPVRGVTS